MDNEFVNLYIETLLKEVTELTKSKILLQTHLDYVQKQNAVFGKQIQDLEAKLASKKSVKVKDDF
jgi:hypothetical protein